MVRSRFLDALSSQWPLRDPVGSFQPRHGHQHHQCFCRGTTSCPRLRGTPWTCRKVILLHRKYLERRHSSVVHGRWRRKVSFRSYDDGCCSCLQRPRVQVCYPPSCNDLRYWHLVDFIMSTNGRQTAPPFLRSTERRMGNSFGSLQRQRRRAHGCKLSSRMWGIRPSKICIGVDFPLHVCRYC